MARRTGFNDDTLRSQDDGFDDSYTDLLPHTVQEYLGDLRAKHMRAPEFIFA